MVPPPVECCTAGDGAKSDAPFSELPKFLDPTESVPRHDHRALPLPSSVRLDKGAQVVPSTAQNRQPVDCICSSETLGSRLARAVARACAASALHFSGPRFVIAQMPAKGVGGMQSGRSNGLNADGSLMNVGNKLSDRPSIRLFTQYSSSSQMEQALSDDWIYGAEPAEAARAPDPAHAAHAHAAHAHPAQLGEPGYAPGQKRRALASGSGLVGPGGQAQRWRTRPQALDTNGNALRAIEDDEADWDVGDGSTGLTPRAQHMQLAGPLVHGPGFAAPGGAGGGGPGHHRSHSQDAVVAHHAAARRQTEQVAAANQLIVQQNLWHAIRAGKRQMVRRAVEDDGGDPMTGNPDEAGITAVHLAAKLSKIGLLEYLLSLPGVDPRVKDSQGRTPADLATNADIRDLLAGRREEQLHRPPPPPGAPSWGAASKAAGAAAPQDRREAAASAAEARAGGDAAAKPWPRRARHGAHDPINPPATALDDDDELGVVAPAAAVRLADAPPTPVKLLGERAGSVFNALDTAAGAGSAGSAGGAGSSGGGPAGADLEPSGGVLAAAAKSAAAAKGKPARGGGGRGPLTKDLFGSEATSSGRGSVSSNRSSGSSDAGGGGGGGGGGGAGGRQVDAEGFPVIEGPPQAAAVLGQEEFLR